MKAFLVSVAFAALGLLALSVPAPAQGQMCMPVPDMLEVVENFGEVVIWEGVTANETTGTLAAVVLFQSESGSWTLAAIDGQMGCVIAVGASGTGKPGEEA